MNAQEAVKRYVQIRDARSDLKKAYDLKDAGLKQAQLKLEALLMQSMDKQGAESLRTDAGTAYITTQSRASCGDWDALTQWVLQEGRTDIFERRVSSSTVNEILNEGGELPPGITLNRERGVNIRRS